MLVFRKKSVIAFYDLGTRLRSVPSDTVFDGQRIREYQSQETTEPDDDRTSEYVEVRFEVQGIYTPAGAQGVAGTLEITEAEHAYLNRALLGSLAPHIEGEPDDVVNPLGFSTVNGSARTVANCQIAHASTIEVNGALPEFPADFVLREPKPEDANERWNPDNIAITENEGAAQSQPKFKKGFIDRIKGHGLTITSNLLGGDFLRGWQYFNFNTDDKVRFKITRQPDFSSDEIEAFVATGKEGVYLRPTLGKAREDADKWSPYILRRAVDDVLIGKWAMRSQFAYPLGLTAFFIACAEAGYPCDFLRSLYAHAVDGLVFHYEGEIVNPLPVGSLVAIITQAPAVFYVWRKIAWGGLGDVS